MSIEMLPKHIIRLDPCTRIEHRQNAEEHALARGFYVCNDSKGDGETFVVGPFATLTDVVAETEHTGIWGGEYILAVSDEIGTPLPVK